MAAHLQVTGVLMPWRRNDFAGLLVKDLVEDQLGRLGPKHLACYSADKVISQQLSQRVASLARELLHQRFPRACAVLDGRRHGPAVAIGLLQPGLEQREPRLWQCPFQEYRSIPLVSVNIRSADRRHPVALPMADPFPGLTPAEPIPLSTRSIIHN